MNFGHGALALGFCPSAKSNPVAEYCTVFTVSAPRDFDTFPSAALASCADAMAAYPQISRQTNRPLLSMTASYLTYRERIVCFTRPAFQRGTTGIDPTHCCRITWIDSASGTRSRRLTRETTDDGPDSFR